MRKQLHHAKVRWPSVVELALWPYATRKSTYLRNCLPDKEDASSPLEKFSNVTVDPKLKGNQSFGCKIYALQNYLTVGV